MLMLLMTEDNKPTVLLKEEGCILSVIKSDTTNTHIFDFKLNGEAYAMVVISDRLYLDFFDLPTIKCLAIVLDFLKEDFGNVKVEMSVAI